MSGYLPRQRRLPAATDADYDKAHHPGYSADSSQWPMQRLATSHCPLETAVYALSLAVRSACAPIALANSCR